ncbi:uncharacterized protein LOC127800617 [Diospyros lotus]|uniref:uncharacterized protein LOC127800617 n=1 Tax=Diospyros lotus TaxID=55363 RepID=UPI002256CE2F|nr:uncharacterized protein LOC127800617 [Diospyros lotus]
MDLGCLDLGCIEKHRNEAFLDSGTNLNDPVMATSKIGKNKALKEAGQSNMNALNKFTSQIKKPPHRKSSPLNWFPRKKVDSYLQRKIQLLQEAEGMNSTLDETLGDTNPHYSRVLREKIAVSKAAHKAMEARKAAMVEASWCRILQAARIRSKEAEALMWEAEKSAVEAFEAATAIGVIMYDTPDCPRKHYEIESLSVNGGGSTTHTVAASFETAFEVDKQVAAAVKAAFIKLASCPSINKKEFKELMQKISQNPDTSENNQELSEISSECESDTGSELESGFHRDDFSSQDVKKCEAAVAEVRLRKYKKRQLCERFNMTKLVDLMLERLRCLREDELASLATIVATCGLNAALAEAESNKQDNLGSDADYGSIPTLNYPRKISSFTAAGARRKSTMDRQMRRKQVEAELPSLDKFLVKHLTKLEREVQEAKNARMNEARERNGEKPEKSDDHKVDSVTDTSSAEAIPDLGAILLKHSSKLEREIEEAKKNSGKSGETEGKNRRSLRRPRQEATDLPSLDKFLVRHVSKLEREVQEAKTRSKIEPSEGAKVCDLKKTDTTSVNQERSESEEVGKENMKPEMDQQKEATLVLKPESTNVEYESLDKVLVKHVSRLEKEKMALGTKEEVAQVKSREPNSASEMSDGGLDQILVKHRSRLEKEKMAAAHQPDGQAKNAVVLRREARERELQEAWRGLSLGNISSTGEGGLDQVLRPMSRLEKAKMAAAAQQEQDDEQQMKPSVARRQARERELQEAWGGLGLGNSMRPHLSRLERDKAAWLKAEEEERRRATKAV